MSTSDIKNQIIKYLFLSIFFLIFGIVYESFSHGIISNYMIFSFLIPFVMGVINYIILMFINKKKKLSIIGLRLYNCSIYTFTLGSVFKGVLEIYGTTNDLISIYFIAGLVLIILSVIIWFVKILK